MQNIVEKVMSWVSLCYFLVLTCVTGWWLSVQNTTFMKKCNMAEP